MFEAKFYQPSISELFEESAEDESGSLLEHLEDLLGVYSTDLEESGPADDSPSESCFPVIQSTGSPPTKAFTQIVKASEIAKRLNKSLRWVYAHGAELGGARIGKTWIFTEEGLADAYKRQNAEAMERANQLAGKKIPGGFSDQKRGHSMGGPEKKRTGGGIEDSEADRHGLVKFLQ